MLTDWTHWISSLTIDRFFVVLGAVLLADCPRYVLTDIAMCLWDWARSVWRYVRGEKRVVRYTHCPQVCAVLPGYNEAKTIAATLASVWGSYPNLEIIVVDDGSQDGMADVARKFAQQHPGTLVLRRPERGGKSSALNFALPYTSAEVIIPVDADSHLAPNAIWEIVQPLADDRVGAVSATVRARNACANLVTWLQAYEYLHSTFMGRMFAARVGILAIVSGAFGAFRRSVLERAMGWDVGPGEDGDLTLRIRKTGYKIAFAPYADCCTNVPTTWWSLFKQRLRWDCSVVTFECRKHIDMAFFWSPNFSFTNLCMLLDRWFFNIVCLYGFWAYVVWFFIFTPHDMGMILLTFYLLFTAFELVQLLVVLYYSNHQAQDLLIAAVLPLVPIYHIFLKVASLLAVSREILFRSSFKDNFVPVHVREATWHW